MEKHELDDGRFLPDENGNPVTDDIRFLYFSNLTEEYKQNRKEEYPSLEEQLDYIYHNGVDAWKADIIDPIKNKYPKPE